MCTNRLYEYVPPTYLFLRQDSPVCAVFHIEIKRAPAQHRRKRPKIVPAKTGTVSLVLQIFVGGDDYFSSSGWLSRLFIATIKKTLLRENMYPAVRHEYVDDDNINILYVRYNLFTN